MFDFCIENRKLSTERRAKTFTFTDSLTQFVCDSAECSCQLCSILLSFSLSRPWQVPIGTRNACSNTGFSFLFVGLCFCHVLIVLCRVQVVRDLDLVAQRWKLGQNHLFSSNFLLKLVFFGRISANPGRSKIGHIKPVRMAYSDCLTDQKRLHKLGPNVNLEKSAFFGTEDHEATHSV